MLTVHSSAEILKFANKDADMLRAYSIKTPFDFLVFGRCAMEPGVDEKTFAYGSNLSEYEGKTVALFSRCCGQYCQRIREGVIRLHPKITWIMPEKLSDYNGGPFNYGAEMLVQDLIKHNLVEEVDKSRA